MTVNWQSLLLQVTDRIRDALKIIDEQASRIALVVDREHRLLGTVTDGDIRRGLLKDAAMDDLVVQVMNTTPLTATSSTSLAEMKRTMLKHGILSMPVVENGIVIGLNQLYDRSKTKNYDNPVFLMAGGFGTRLRPLTNDCPKPLLKVGDKPILEITLENFINCGFKNFYISTHFMAEKIRQHFGEGEKWAVNITYVYEEKPLGTGGALGLLPGNIHRSPLIMMNGDILTTIDFEKLLEFHTSSEADATICVREYEYQVPYGVIYGQGSRVVKMEEKPVQRFYVNAGIYVLNNALVQGVKKNKKIDMPALLEKKIADHSRVLMFPLHEYWLDIGRMDDFMRAQSDINSLEFKANA